MPSHYLNQCLVIVDWTLRDKLQWNSNQKTKLFIHQNASENIVCQKAAILSRGRLVKNEGWDSVKSHVTSMVNTNGSRLLILIFGEDGSHVYRNSILDYSAYQRDAEIYFLNWWRWHCAVCYCGYQHRFPLGSLRNPCWFGNTTCSRSSSVNITPSCGIMTFQKVECAELSISDCFGRPD